MFSRIISLAFIFLLQPTLGSAFSCGPLIGPYPVGQEPTSEEIAKDMSLALNGLFRGRGDSDLLVFGKFSRTNDGTLLHLDVLEEYRELFLNRPSEIVLPYRVSFTYLSELAFKGYEISGNELVPFESEQLELEISISEEYEGVVDSIPPIEVNIVGVLRSTNKSWLSIDTGICPSYFEVTADQLEAYRNCLREKECR